MPYVRSVYRTEFDARVKSLALAAKTAERTPGLGSALRAMVFQCAIFQTSAAIEDYLRLLVETWIFRLDQKGLGKHVPPSTRGFVALRALETSFAKYAFNGDESALSEAIAAEGTLWSFLLGSDQVPGVFSGKLLHDKTAYPSFKNLKRILRRVGIDNAKGRLNSALKADVETLIEGFQSIRTAIAHSSPPALTLADVQDRISDMMKLVGAIDRLMHKHVLAHGGSACWA